MLTLYRTKSFLASPVPDTMRIKLTSILLKIFTFAELTLMGASNREKMLHLMREFLAEIQRTAFATSGTLAESEYLVVLKDNKYVLLDSLETLINATDDEVMLRTLDVSPRAAPT